MTSGPLRRLEVRGTQRMCSNRERLRTATHPRSSSPHQPSASSLAGSYRERARGPSPGTEPMPASSLRFTTLGGAPVKPHRHLRERNGNRCTWGPFTNVARRSRVLIWVAGVRGRARQVRGKRMGMGQEAGGKAGLFASVLDADAHRTERRARLLRMVPLVLALHLVAVLLLAPGQPEAVHLPIRAGDDDAPVLTLLAARPVLPPAVAPAAPPAPAVPRRVVARQVPARLRPPPPPTRAREVKEAPPPPQNLPEVDDAPSSPPDTSEAEGGAVPEGVAPDSVVGAAVGEVVGGLMRGVLASGLPAPPPSLTPEERAAWVERYLERLIRSRFMHVRYPHKAAAGGISGEVMLRMSINAQGRLLKLELIGRCPHPVLCDSAQEVVRNAQPFPPPPRELGNPLILDLPFRYHLY
jgi:periplasmic protein TonB